MNGRQSVLESLGDCCIEIFRELVLRPRWTWDEGDGVIEEDTWDSVVVISIIAKVDTVRHGPAVDSNHTCGLPFRITDYNSSFDLRG